MESILGLSTRKPKPSPLEGFGASRAQQSGNVLKQLSRREAWLWVTAFFVTLLSAVAFVLSSFPSFFQRSEHFYEIRSDQARWGVMCLLLLFNGWLLYRHWSLRRERRALTTPDSGTEAPAMQISDPSGFDPVTGLHTRRLLELQLGKEIARTKRQNYALSLATVHIEEFDEASQRYGQSAMDQALKELARRLKKACRGSDFAVRLAKDDFLLVLPECNLGEVKLVLNRIGALELAVSGRKVSLTYSTGWVDYQAGDTPTDLVKRAADILHLYENAAKSSSAALTLR